MSGQVILIPVTISDGTQSDLLPSQVVSAIKECDLFFVENIRTARRFISSLKLGLTIENLQFETLDKKTSYEECFNLIKGVRREKPLVLCRSQVARHR